MTEQDKSAATLKEMAIRGSDYREDYEFELYGEDVVAIIRPLVDDEFLPIAAFLKSRLDEEDLDTEEAVDEAVEQVEEAAEETEGDDIDVSMLDEEFVAAMQEAARLGLYGDYDEDGEEREYTNEEREQIVGSLMGGYSVELGARVLEISGSVRDAEKFRGGRGSISDTRSSE
jgi:hypothetical protein